MRKESEFRQRLPKFTFFPHFPREVGTVPITQIKSEFNNIHDSVKQPTRQQQPKQNNNKARIRCISLKVSSFNFFFNLKKKIKRKTNLNGCFGFSTGKRAAQPFPENSYSY